MWFLGKKADFDDSEIKRNRNEVFSKWNKCRIYVGPLSLDGANSRKCLIIVDRQAEHVAFFSQSVFIFYESE
jgi:hypothetical protein